MELLAEDFEDVALGDVAEADEDAVEPFGRVALGTHGRLELVRRYLAALYQCVAETHLFAAPSVAGPKVRIPRYGMGAVPSSWMGADCPRLHSYTG